MGYDMHKPEQKSEALTPHIATQLGDEIKVRTNEVDRLKRLLAQAELRRANSVLRARKALAVASGASGSGLASLTRAISALTLVDILMNEDLASCDQFISALRTSTFNVAALDGVGPSVFAVLVGVVCTDYL